MKKDFTPHFFLNFSWFVGVLREHMGLLEDECSSNMLLSQGVTLNVFREPLNTPLYISKLHTLSIR